MRFATATVRAYLHSACLISLSIGGSIIITICSPFLYILATCVAFLTFLMQLSLRILHCATNVATFFITQPALRLSFYNLFATKLDGNTALFRSVLRILFCILLVKFLAFVFKKIDNLVGAIKSHVVDHDKIVERNGFALKLYLVKTFF